MKLLGAFRLENINTDSRKRYSPFTFEELLDRAENKKRNELFFHIHVPRVAGNDVTQFMRRNNVKVLDHDLSSDFFSLTTREAWLEYLRLPQTHHKYMLSGHYRFSNKFFKECEFEHTCIALLRNPIDRLLSQYELTKVSPQMAGFSQINAGQMSIVDYAEQQPREWKQYTYFDFSGSGELVDNGNSTAQECLENFMLNVGVFGFNTKIEEFHLILSFLGGLSLIPLTHKTNETVIKQDAAGIPKSEQYKKISDQERATIEEILSDDIWFYDQAMVEYENRLRHPRIKEKMEFLGLVESSREALRALARHFPDY